MGVFDKFLSMMNLNDEEDFEEDDFYDDEDMGTDTAYEEKSRHRSSRIAKGEESSSSSHRHTERPRAKASSKVTPLRQSRKQQGGADGGLQVRVIRPTSVEDSRDISETLLYGRTVVLNLEGLDLEIAQRIIDFTSGTCFALDGNLQKISQYIFLLTPANVDISGDLTDILNGSFDVPSVRPDY